MAITERKSSLNNVGLLLRDELEWFNGAIPISTMKNTGQTQLGTYYDPKILLHSNHIHSGQWGRWGTRLSTQQLTFIEEQTHDWLVAYGYSMYHASLQSRSLWPASNSLFPATGLLGS